MNLLEKRGMIQDSVISTFGARWLSSNNIWKNVACDYDSFHQDHHFPNNGVHDYESVLPNNQTWYSIIIQWLRYYKIVVIVNGIYSNTIQMSQLARGLHCIWQFSGK